jgi:hypothetical protein
MLLCLQLKEAVLSTLSSDQGGLSDEQVDAVLKILPSPVSTMMQGIAFAWSLGVRLPLSWREQQAARA